MILRRKPKAAEPGAKPVKKKKRTQTATARVTRTLRAMWFISPERKAAIARSHMHCERCGKKLARSRNDGDTPEVHHLDGVTWTEIVRLIVEQLLVDVDRLLVVCKGCHKEADREVRVSKKGQRELPL